MIPLAIKRVELLSSKFPCTSSTLFTYCREVWDCLSHVFCRQPRHDRLLSAFMHKPKFSELPVLLQSTYNNYTLTICRLFKLCSSRMASRRVAHLDSFTEFSRCELDSNNQCCAGTVGQGHDCFYTNLTASLELYLFSALGKSESLETTAPLGRQQLP